MTIRVYAIYGKNRRILYVLVSALVITSAVGGVRKRPALPVVILIGQNQYAFLAKSPNSPQLSPDPPQGCLRSISQQK